MNIHKKHAGKGEDGKEEPSHYEISGQLSSESITGDAASRLAFVSY